MPTLEELNAAMLRADAEGKKDVVARYSARIKAAGVQMNVMGTTDPKAGVSGVEGDVFTEGGAQAAVSEAASRPQQLLTRGMADIAGIPMDTLQNLWNLGGATAGYLGHEAGLIPTDKLEGMISEEPWPGSSQWLKDRGGLATGAGPQNLGEEIVEAAPNALLGPKGGTAALMKNIGATVLPTVFSHAAREQKAGPLGQTGAAVTADVLQTLLSRHGPTALRKSLGGGPQVAQEAARQRSAGITTPAAATLTGNEPHEMNPLLRAGEAWSGIMPGGDIIAERARRQREKQVGARTSEVAGGLTKSGKPATAESAGRAMEVGGYEEAQRIGQVQERLYNTISQRVNPQAQVTLTKFETLLRDLTTKEAGAEKMTGSLVHPKIQQLLRDFEEDMKHAGGPQILDPSGNPFAASTPNNVSWRAADKLRKSFGRAIANSGLVADFPAADFKALHAALLEDMENTLPKGSPGRRAWERARRYTRVAHETRLDPMNRVLNANTNERILSMALSGNQQGAGLIRSMLKGAGERGANDIRSYIIDNLGLSKPSARGGFKKGPFSFDTFGTNWSKLHPDVQKILFSDPAVRQAMDEISTTAMKYAKGGGLLYNPPGTAHAGAWAIVGVEFIRNVIAGDVRGAAGAAAAPPIAVGLQLGMKSPAFIKWLGGSTKVPPDRRLQYLAQLQTIAQQTTNKEEKQAYQALHDWLIRQQREKSAREGTGLPSGSDMPPPAPAQGRPLAPDAPVSPHVRQ